MNERCFYCGRELIDVPYYAITASREIFDSRTGEPRILDESFQIVYAHFCDSCFSQHVHQIGIPSPPSMPTYPPVIREREVVTRVVVKIPCSRCGALILQESVKCPNCGAPLRH